jgi:hypothetical protein
MMKREESQKIQELPTLLIVGGSWVGPVEHILWWDACHNPWSTRDPVKHSGGVTFRQQAIPRAWKGASQSQIRPCSVVWDWSPGLISSRITFLIYIDFDELEWILAYSDTTERALRVERKGPLLIVVDWPPNLTCFPNSAELKSRGEHRLTQGKPPRGDTLPSRAWGYCRG